jgi:hypothetical protein
MDVDDRITILKRRGIPGVPVSSAGLDVDDRVLVRMIGGMKPVALPISDGTVSQRVILVPFGKDGYIPITHEAVPPDPCVDGVTNIFVNGDFETGFFPPWTINSPRHWAMGDTWSISSVEKYEGDYGAYLVATPGYYGLYGSGIIQTLDLLGTDYVTGYIKGSANWFDVRFVCGSIWSGSCISLKTYVASEWTKFCFKLGDIPGWADGVQIVGFYAYLTGPGTRWLALDKIVLHRA